MERHRKKQNDNQRPPRSISQPSETQRRKSMKSRSPSNPSEFAPTNPLSNSPTNNGDERHSKFDEDDKYKGDRYFDGRPDEEFIGDRLKLGKSCGDRCPYKSESDPFCLDAREARMLLSLLKVKPIPNACDCLTFCCNFLRQYNDEEDD